MAFLGTAVLAYRPDKGMQIQKTEREEWGWPLELTAAASQESTGAWPRDGILLQSYKYVAVPHGIAMCSEQLG